MKKNALAWFAVFAICALPLSAEPKQYSDEEYEVCYQLFDVSGQKATYDFAMDAMMQEQLAAYARLGMADTEKLGSVLREFLAKYMSYDSIKEELAQIYLRNFTVQELKDLTTFYQTPLGSKVAEKMPSMTVEASKLGIQHVVEHQDELAQMIIQSMQKDATPTQNK